LLLAGLGRGRDVAPRLRSLHAGPLAAALVGRRALPRRRQVDGARPMDEVFANIDGVLSAFIEDHAPAEAAVA